MSFAAYMNKTANMKVTDLKSVCAGLLQMECASHCQTLKTDGLTPTL